MTPVTSERGLPELLGASHPGRVLVALWPVDQAEHLAFARGALRAVRPDVTPRTTTPAPPLTGTSTLRRMLEAAGVRDIQLETTTWKVAVASADDLLDLVVDVPDVAAVIGRMTEAELREVRQILDGMLRERSGGTPGAVLHAEVRIATGTSPDNATPKEEGAS